MYLDVSQYFGEPFRRLRKCEVIIGLYWFCHLFPNSPLLKRQSQKDKRECMCLILRPSKYILSFLFDLLIHLSNAPLRTGRGGGLPFSPVLLALMAMKPGKFNIPGSQYHNFKLCGAGGTLTKKKSWCQQVKLFLTRLKLYMLTWDSFRMRIKWKPKVQMNSIFKALSEQPRDVCFKDSEH